MECNIKMFSKSVIYTVTYGVGMVSRTLNIDSRLSELSVYPNAWILELAKGVRIIEAGLYII